MKPLVLTLVACGLVSFDVGSTAAGKVAYEWNFSNAADTLGWTQAESLKSFGVDDGALVAVAGPGRPKLTSPLFDLQASPWQYVEIEMKTDADGHALMYYSNTTDEPYGGFRPQLYVMFDVIADGNWHTYTVRPFWQKQGKIVHIRLDPPGDKVAVRAVRIVDAKPSTTAETPSWKFKNTDAGWRAVGGKARIEATAEGLRIVGDQDTCLLSPPLEMDPDDLLWVTVRAKSDVPQVALFRWACEDTDGLHSAPVLLRGDGLVHTYAVDLSEYPEWSGKIVAVGITPTDAVEPQRVILQSVILGKEPIGPADLEITWFGPEYPIVRVGQKARLTAEVKNTGGSDAVSVQGRLSLLDTALRRTNTLPPRTIARLAPGRKARFEWEIDVKDERKKLAVCRITGLGLDAGERSVEVQPRPRPAGSRYLAGTSGRTADQARASKGARSAAYVPEPIKADTGKYLVGCYYYPGWHTYERWSVLEDFPERKPVLGWYREGAPEIADWHIKWALEHGISFFIYDWYWDRGKRQLEHALHDGFLKSRYKDRMKFCLLWANHNPENTSSEQDCLDVTRFWIQNYFRLPNYLKVDGRNVVVIFSPDRLTQDMGSDMVRATFDKMRKLCEEAGAGGLYLVACTYPGRDRVQRLVREGYDALSGYNYPSAGSKGRRIAPYEWMVEGYKDYWNQIADASTIPYIPVCEPGWDSRPWHGYNSLVRTGKSPALWRKMLENAKTFVEQPSHRQDGDKKLVFLEAWNEFGEGDYIEPHAQFGFDYLEAVREVFAPNSMRPEIVAPPDIGMGPYEIAKPRPRTAWVFSDPKDQDWTVGNMTDLSFEGGVMSAVAQNRDPAFYSPGTDIDASRFKTVEIKMRMNKGTEAQLFFARHRGKMTEEKSVRFPVVGDNEWHTYTIDMSRNARWQGRIGQLRLDPNSESGSKVRIAYVKLR